MSGSYLSDESAKNVLGIISPARKNPKGKRIGSRQKTIIIYMYKDIIEKNPVIKYDDLCVNLHHTTGVGRKSIEKIIAEYKKTNTVTSPNAKRCKKSLFDKIDDLDRNGLRQKVHSIWLKRELPTIDKILIAVNEDPSLPTFKRTTFYTTIKKLDFVFTKRKRYSVLTEREDLIIWRRRYLHDIRKYRREGRTIYYLDETWLNAGDCVDRVCVDKRLILLHIGSEQGFLAGGLLCFQSKTNSGDYHDEINDNKLMIISKSGLSPLLLGLIRIPLSLWTTNRTVPSKQKSSPQQIGRKRKYWSGSSRKALFQKDRC